VIVECLTDNTNRTASNIRVLFRKGQLGALGSVSWDFDYLGMIEAMPETAQADAELAAIEAGARDLEPGEDGATLFLTEPAEMDAVSRTLPAYGFAVQSAQLCYRPKNPVTLGEAERAEVEAFLEAIDADDDVQNVFVGLAG
jgi:transcriptional/translational regulatory protein YebC/TACO1